MRDAKRKQTRKATQTKMKEEIKKSIAEAEPLKSDFANLENVISNNNLNEGEEKKNDEIPIVVVEEEKKNEEENVLKSGNDKNDENDGNEKNEEKKNEDGNQEEKKEENGSGFVGEEFAYMEDEEIDVKNVG